MAVIDFTGVDARAALPRRTSKKIGRHAQESPRLDIVFKLDFSIQGVKDARPVLLSIEIIDLPGKRCSKAPSDQRGSWVGLSQFGSVGFHPSTPPAHKRGPEDWTQDWTQELGN